MFINKDLNIYYLRGDQNVFLQKFIAKEALNSVKYNVYPWFDFRVYCLTYGANETKIDKQESNDYEMAPMKEKAPPSSGYMKLNQPFLWHDIGMYKVIRYFD